jgi:maltooligosyltrehalose trehalohydrolase
MQRKHEMPFGAECRNDGTVRFRLWAPKARGVDVVLPDSNSRPISLVRHDEGWFELVTGEAGPGTRYQFQIDAGVKVPDPASRFQPFDVPGPSEVVNPAAFDWQDDDWRGLPWAETVIYELHVGTFTAAGTFTALQENLDHLVGLGVTAIELMPISDFPGRCNWGYDGVLPYAPDSSYGLPEDLKRLIQSAHQKGLMVFLDVVYNHFGPEGNYLREYSPEFFTQRHRTPWGDAINFDGGGSRQVRDFFIHNALYWLEEYHFDGLRLDAVHAIVDDSVPDILTELAQTIRQVFGLKRQVHLVLEDYNNAARYLERDPQGRARLYDAQWNDDIHHALHVLTTGEIDGYYSDYAQRPIHQLGRCLTEGFAYQGERSECLGGARGENSRHLPPAAFVSFLQNHDQVGNRAFGDRIVEVAELQAVKAAMAILLLAPSPPLLFMGEEFSAKTPFLFFCDFDGKLAANVREGRRAEFAGFGRFSSQEIGDQIPDPNSEQTFIRSKIDWESLKEEQSQEWLRFYRALLALRKKEIVPHLNGIESGRQASFKTYAERGIFVEWHLGDTVLSLVANLGSAPTAPLARPCGRTIYVSAADLSAAIDGGIEQIEMPAWSVAWFLCP